MKLLCLALLGFVVLSEAFPVLPQLKLAVDLSPDDEEGCSLATTSKLQFLNLVKIIQALHRLSKYGKPDFDFHLHWLNVRFRHEYKSRHNFQGLQNNV